LKRQDKALLRQLKATGLQHAEKALGQLKAYARQVLAYPPELTGLLQTSLTSEIKLYRCLGENIGQIEREVALQLAKTPGAMMTPSREPANPLQPESLPKSDRLAPKPARVV